MLYDGDARSLGPGTFSFPFKYCCHELITINGVRTISSVSLGKTRENVYRVQMTDKTPIVKKNKITVYKGFQRRNRPVGR